MFAALLANVSSAQTLNGRWEGTIAFDALKVPFTLHISTDGSAVMGSFANGAERVHSTSGTFANGQLRLKFQGGELQAKFVDASLRGSYGEHSIEASLYCTCAYEGEAGADIRGSWSAAVDPRHAWRLSVRREGEDTLATLYRGETTLGPITGRFDGLQFTLRYFDGSRAALLEMEPKKDGTLAIVFQEPGQPTRKATAIKATDQ